MSKALTPEVLDVTSVYIENGFDLARTCEQTGLSHKEVSDIITHPQAKSYINEVFLDTGYRNRGKLGAVLDRMIESKLEEAEETEMYTEADLLELVKFAHKMRMDEAKIDSVGTNVNIANFGDSNYAGLVQKLLNGK
tara:strand:+ start:237 stop:647 length:411 start_codon:yes stop_codon:yes gene_type:complete